MHGPVVPGWLLVALCAAAGASFLVRLAGCAGHARRAAAGEALMGFGMAAMGVPAAVLTPPPWLWAAYAVLFAAAAAPSLASLASPRTGRRTHGHAGHHLVGSLAMVYMAAVMALDGAAGAAHGAHGARSAVPGGLPLLTAGLLAYYAVYVLRTGARLAPAGPAPGPGGGRAAATEVAPACRLAMALGMVAMLLAL
ncbi:DUF5134 domain-containing protein [Streptomyces sp. ODS05-4]|uniref:DUF5134 domain-containing protein n=1 Tax=Streptomyces sp. ODS05-4 TaxID=2944939 RepID=UPI00210D9F81|nr:DUF5134 domain-containing protein [Streptomyces sp. ODS05-4]